MADLFCALDHMCKSGPQKTLVLNVPSWCVCVTVQTHAHWPYNVRHIILHLLQGGTHQNNHVLRSDVNVTGINSALIHNINRQAMNLRAESDILPCIMVAALHSSVSREQTNWHEIQQWSGNRSLKERLILPNPSHPRLSGFPVTGGLGRKHRRISSIHAHHHHRARGCWGQPLMNGERECGRVA